MPPAGGIHPPPWAKSIPAWLQVPPRSQAPKPLKISFSRKRDLKFPPRHRHTCELKSGWAKGLSCDKTLNATSPAPQKALSSLAGSSVATCPWYPATNGPHRREERPTHSIPRLRSPRSGAQARGTLRCSPTSPWPPAWGCPPPWGWSWGGGGCTLPDQPAVLHIVLHSEVDDHGGAKLVNPLEQRRYSGLLQIPRHRALAPCLGVRHGHPLALHGVKATGKSSLLNANCPFFLN